MKVGLDIHGCIDQDPEFFSQLAQLVLNDGGEVHIVTGQKKEEIIPELLKYKVPFTHFFSITDYHIEIGTEVTYDEKNRPYLGDNLWNRTKGDYCDNNNISFHIDDSSIYSKYFYRTVYIKYDKNHDVFKSSKDFYDLMCVTRRY